YIAWVGLRGAVPIVLALFPLMFGLPHAQTLFQIAFVVVIVSLLLQGSTVALAARRLGVVLPPVAEPLRRTDLPLPVEPPLSFMQFKVEENATARGLSAASLPRFDNLQTIGVVRERQLRPIGEDCRFKAGDVVCVLAEEAAAPALVAFFSDAQAQTQSADDTLCFMLDGRARLADIRAFYALDLPDAEEQMSLSAYLRLRLGERLVTGDTLEIAGALLRVLEMHEGHVTRVGLSLTDGAR
ncbi:MAG: transporter associated domain-containing protein, partial [Halothiobacillaceae bacterium]|nr:transporter associated domain-containing protein [Halothiobacillaceae bacterium]